MTELTLFPLDSAGRWRLAHDANQWIIQRRVGSPRPGKGAAVRDTGWRGISFIGSKKATLERLFREKGISLTPEAQARLDALPERFMDFIAVPERFVAQLEAEAA